MLKYALLRMAVVFLFSRKQCKSVPVPHKSQVKHIQQNASVCFFKDWKGKWLKQRRAEPTSSHMTEKSDCFYSCDFQTPLISRSLLLTFRLTRSVSCPAKNLIQGPNIHILKQSYSSKSMFTFTKKVMFLGAVCL